MMSSISNDIKKQSTLEFISPIEQKNKSLFNRMKKIVLQVVTTDEQTIISQYTGFFLEKDVVVSIAHHSLHNGNIRNVYFPTNDIHSRLEPTEEMNIGNAEALDMLLFYSKVEFSEDNLLKELPESVEIFEGMEVYYAGFPYGSKKITFHKGMISSVSTEKGFREFTIDGTVVHGNSGGPVVAIIDSEPYVIGMITSEMADFKPEDMKTIELMKKYKDFQTSASSSPSFVSTDSRGQPTSFGTEGIISYISGIGKVNDRDILGRALDLIQRNLSSGIGRAIDIREYIHLYSETLIKGSSELLYHEPLGYRSEIELRTLLGDDFIKDTKIIRSGKNKISTSKENLIYIQKTYPLKYNTLIQNCLGIGGLHRFTKQYSLLDNVDSDHTIPHDVWKSTTNQKLKKLVKGSGKRPGERDMPAITISHSVHERLKTTGSSGTAISFRNHLTTLCDEDKIKCALILCFKEYKNCGMKLEEYKEGINNMLEEYKKINIITNDELIHIQREIGF